MKKTNSPWMGVLVSVLMVGGTAVASNLTLPHTFTANTTAKASEVNDNFAAVKAAVDDTQAQVTAISNEFSRLSGNLVFKDVNGRYVGQAFDGHPIYQDANGFFWPLDDETGAIKLVDYSTGEFFESSNCSGVGYLDVPNKPGWAFKLLGATYVVSRTRPAKKSMDANSSRTFGTTQCSTTSTRLLGAVPSSAFTPSAPPAVTWTGPLHLEVVH